MKLKEAMNSCWVRGFIYQKSYPEKHYYKNSLKFDKLPNRLTQKQRDANDWNIHDADGEDCSIRA